MFHVKHKSPLEPHHSDLKYAVRQKRGCGEPKFKKQDSFAECFT